MVILLGVFYTNFNTINSFFNVCNADEIETKRDEIVYAIKNDYINGCDNFKKEDIKVISLEKAKGLTFVHSELQRFL